MAFSPEPQPSPFFTIRVHRPANAPSVSGLCIGYERGTWRATQFAEHIFEWLPEFALNWTEREGLRHENSVRLLRRAAANVYMTKKFGRRGEFGELFLHAAIRQVFNSSPAISKIYYKDSHNNTVKGFDAVHAVDNKGELELWLGEVKFYSDYKQAVRDVVAEIADHTKTQFLRSEFALILTKVDPKWPHAAALKSLMDPAVSLDKVFARACIPVLLTYESPCLQGHTACDTAYVKSFIGEIDANYKVFAATALPKDIHIHLFLLPLHTKKALIAELDGRLKQWQNI